MSRKKQQEAEKVRALREKQVKEERKKKLIEERQRREEAELHRKEESKMKELEKRKMEELKSAAKRKERLVIIGWMWNRSKICRTSQRHEPKI